MPLLKLLRSFISFFTFKSLSLTEPHISIPIIRLSNQFCRLLVDRLYLFNLYNLLSTPTCFSKILAPAPYAMLGVLYE